MFKNFLWVSLKEKLLGNIGLDGVIILKWLLKEEEGKVWTGLNLLRMGRSGAGCLGEVRSG
jgi:hypothetical protein